MGSQEVKTFCFTGEPEVGTCIEAMLKAGGFTQAKVADADVVFTYRISESELEDLYYESSGILQLSKKDAVLIDLSPSTVSFAQELCAMGSVSEKHVLDAPLVIKDILAPDAFSKSQNLGIVAGGSEDVFKRVEPMLRSIASHVMWMGKAGCGQSTKIALTLSSAATLVGLVEAYTAMRVSKVSIDEEDFVDVASAFSMLTPAQESFVLALSENDFEDASFTIEYAMGELAAALASVDDNDLILPQAEACFRLMELLAMVGGVSYDPSALKLVFADEETSKKYGLDWSRVEGAYDHSKSDHECDCDDNCDCGHHHHHDSQSGSSGYISFSSN